MPPSIVYRSPLGDSKKNPDDSFLREIANKPSEYWESGSGDSCLEVEGASERMIFFYVEALGFFMMMHPDYEVVIRDTGSVKTIQHRIGGEPMKVPSYCYLNRDKAFALMQEFVKNGGRPTSVVWQDMYSIDFDHDF
jgi:hypothetical protein